VTRIYECRFDGLTEVEPDDSLDAFLSGDDRVTSPVDNIFVRLVHTKHF
jgi:hypothetical protein